MKISDALLLRQLSCRLYVYRPVYSGPSVRPPVGVQAYSAIKPYTYYCGSRDRSDVACGRGRGRMPMATPYDRRHFPLAPPSLCQQQPQERLFFPVVRSPRRRREVVKRSPLLAALPSPLSPLSPLGDLPIHYSACTITQCIAGRTETLRTGRLLRSDF